MPKLITLNSVLLFLFLSFASAQSKAIKKTDPIIQPLGESASISWGDVNTLNWKLNAAFASMAVWLLIEAYQSFKKSKDNTAKDIKDMKEILTKIMTELQHRPTKDEVEDKIKEGILYANGLRNK